MKRPSTAILAQQPYCGPRSSRPAHRRPTAEQPRALALLQRRTYTFSKSVDSVKCYFNRLRLLGTLEFFAFTTGRSPTTPGAAARLWSTWHDHAGLPGTQSMRPSSRCGSMEARAKVEGCGTFSGVLSHLITLMASSRGDVSVLTSLRILR